MVVMQIILALSLLGIIHYIVFMMWRDFEEPLEDVPLAIITAFTLWMDYLLITTQVQVVL